MSQPVQIGARPERSVIEDGWILAGALCLTLVAVLPFIFYGTSSALVRAWNDTTAYNYCLLILPISAYLVWERRDTLLAAPPRPTIFGFALLCAAATMWLLGELSGTRIVSEFALVAMAQSIVVANLGIRAGRTLLFPLCYLFFLVPMGESLIPPLQTITAEFAVFFLKLTGVPVRSDALMIHVPNATWVVAEACAGVKFLIASIALGTLLSAMFLCTWRRRALLIALSAIVPIIANGVRVYIIVLIGYLTNDAMAASADHILYGWLLFAMILLGLVGIAVAMREPDAEPGASKAHGPSNNRLQMTKSSSWTVIAAVCSLLLVVSIKAAAASLAALPVRSALPSALPLTIRGGWIALARTDPTPPVFFGADRVWHRAYSDGTTTIYLSVAYFAFERPGAEIASSQHQFGGATPVVQTEERIRDIDVAGRAISANALTFRHRDGHRLLWHWLWVDGRYTGSPYLAKLLQLKAKLLGGPSAAAIISISADYAGNRDRAAAALNRFANSLGEIGSSTKPARTRR